MQQERSNIVFPPGPTSAAQPLTPFVPARDPGPLLPLGCWPWKQAHFPQTPVAQCLWLSCLGHLCAPVPGDSEHWDLVPAHCIQVIIQGQQDLRRKVQARFRSCWPGRSSFQTLRPCLYGRCSQICESLVTAAAPELPQNSCVTHSPRGNLRPGGTGREIKEKA